MKRKLLSVLLTLCMIVSLCGAMALTSYATPEVKVCAEETTDPDTKPGIISRTLFIGTKEYKNISITSSSGLWIIRIDNDPNDLNKGCYLYVDDDTNQLVTDSNNMFKSDGWKFDGQYLYTEKKTIVKKKVLFFWRYTTVTTRYYLTQDEAGIGETPNGEVKIINTYNDHNYEITSNDSTTHTWTCQNCGDTYNENHIFEGESDTCKFCSEQKISVAGIRSIDVNIETKVSRKLADIIRGRSKQYTVKITPHGDEGISVKSIRYSLDGRDTWGNGDTFVMYSYYFDLYIEITDNNDNVTTWHYSTDDKNPEKI